MVDEIGKAFTSRTVAADVVNALTQKIGRESCFKCHLVHLPAKVRPGQRGLIHGAAGGVGTALLRLGRLAGLEMYGTCSSRGASTVSDIATPAG